MTEAPAETPGPFSFRRRAVKALVNACGARIPRSETHLVQTSRDVNLEAGECGVFLHLMDRTEAIQDEEGVEASDLDEARTHALNAIQEIRASDAAREWGAWRLEASDQAGSLLFSLNLRTFR